MRTRGALIVSLFPCPSVKGELFLSGWHYGACTVLHLGIGGRHPRIHEWPLSLNLERGRTNGLGSSLCPAITTLPERPERTSLNGNRTHLLLAVR